MIANSSRAFDRLHSEYLRVCANAHTGVEDADIEDDDELLAIVDRRDDLLLRLMTLPAPREDQLWTKFGLLETEIFDDRVVGRRWDCRLLVMLAAVKADTWRFMGAG